MRRANSGHIPQEQKPELDREQHRASTGTGSPIKYGRVFLVPSKSDLSSVRFCTRVHHGQVTFNKVSETQVAMFK